MDTNPTTDRASMTLNAGGLGIDVVCGDVRIHQPVPVTGYRPLTAQEVALMNEGKALANQVGAFIEKLAGLQGLRADPDYKDGPEVYPHIDGRWLAIAKTELQQGFMFLGRSIAKPQGF